MSRKRITVLGSTGSIGRGALDVAARHPDRFEVVGLTAGANDAVLEAQIEAFRPRVVALRDPDAATRLADRLNGSGPQGLQTGRLCLPEILEIGRSSYFVCILGQMS